MLKHPYASLDGVSLKKLTAANSMFIEDVAFYVVKKNYEGKAFFAYAAYLYPSGISIGFHPDKKLLKEMLTKGIDKVKTFMRDYEVEGI